MDHTISRQEAVEMIRGLEDGRIFTVIFQKRTVDKETGKQEIRIMNCRQRVTKHLAGGPAAYSFNEKGLVSVFDLTKMAYRSFPIDGLIAVRAHGDTFFVSQAKVETI